MVGDLAQLPYAISMSPSVVSWPVMADVMEISDPAHPPFSPAPTPCHTLPLLQVRQFEGMLSPLLVPALPSLPNAQMAWAALAVEELTRLGVATFAVAPGEARGSWEGKQAGRQAGTAYTGQWSLPPSFKKQAACAFNQLVFVQQVYFIRLPCVMLSNVGTGQ